MSNIDRGSYDKKDLAEYFGIDENRIRVTESSDNDRVNRRYSENWDGIHHPETGEKLKFSHEFYRVKNINEIEVLSTVFKGQNGQEYSYTKQEPLYDETDGRLLIPAKSVEKQIAEDYQEYEDKFEQSKGIENTDVKSEDRSIGEYMREENPQEQENGPAMGIGQAVGNEQTNTNGQSPAPAQNQDQSQSQ